jgi:hypothetical protein
LLSKPARDASRSHLATCKGRDFVPVTLSSFGFKVWALALRAERREDIVRGLKFRRLGDILGCRVQGVGFRIKAPGLWYI